MAQAFESIPIEQLEERDFHRIVDTNVLGYLLAAREALKHVDNIITMTSVVSETATPTYAVHASTRGAIEVRVNAIARGGVDSARMTGAHLVGSSSCRERKQPRKSRLSVASYSQCVANRVVERVQHGSVLTSR